MYRHCIYCSGDLGANEAVEAFPVGRTLAFDAKKGRLWAVCGKCARWNLAPMEERWEPVEEAERLFRDARLRVQSENVGLARLPDGTRLIRVGSALPGELAAWRYGDEMRRRYRQKQMITGFWTVGLLGAFYTIGPLYQLITWAGGALWERHRGNLPLCTLAGEEVPGGGTMHLLHKHLQGAVLRPAAGGVELRLRGTYEYRDPRTGRREREDNVVLPDRTARRVLERGMVHLNRSGARPGALHDALGRLASAGSAEAYVRRVAAHRMHLPGGDLDRWMDPITSVALEMALHEEQERRALEGELAVLEAAWRDAEPVAEIADRLALDPPGAE